MASKKNKFKIPSTWKKVGESESSDFPTQGISVDDPQIGDTYGDNVETLQHMGTEAVQSGSLEWADDAIGIVDEEAAEAWREYVQEAREKSPTATTVAALLTPDLLDAVTGGMSKARKVYKAAGIIKSALTQGAKGAAQAGATDVVSQFGEQEELGAPDLTRTALASGLGGTARGAVGTLANVPSLRKSAMGSLKSDFAKKVGPENAEDTIQSYADELGQMGLFESGSKGFDPTAMKFTSPAKGKLGNKIKGSIIPPSQKEIKLRVKAALKSISDERDSLVTRGSAESSPQLDMLEGPSHIEVKGAFTQESFKNEMIEALDEIGFDSPAQKKKAGQMMKDQAELLWTGGEGSMATLEELHKFRKMLDDKVNYRASRETMDPVKEQVMRAMAKALRNRVSPNTVNPSKYEDLSRHYSMLKEVERGLDRKLVSDTKTSKAVGSPSMLIRILGAVEAAGDAGMAVAGQVSDSVQKANRFTSGSGVRAIRKAPQVLLGEEETQSMFGEEGVNEDLFNRKPQGQFNAMPASERLNMNFPKELMKSKIPRTTEGLQENSRLFKLKIGQEADNIVRERMVQAGVDVGAIDPMEIQREATELYKNVDTVIEEHPDDLPAMLPVWIQQYPSMFEKDRYNRIDGVVPNSMQPLVREEIRKNSNISNVERIRQLDLLNRSGEYND